MWKVQQQIRSRHKFYFSNGDGRGSEREWRRDKCMRKTVKRAMCKQNKMVACGWIEAGAEAEAKAF